MNSGMIKWMGRAVGRFGGASLLLLLVAGGAAAQTGNGQICLSAFEDTNGSQFKDVGEPPITQDVVVELADAQGIIVQSLHLNDAPQASSGTVCFSNLAPGQYTVTAKSAVYAATTNVMFLTSVDTSGTIQRFDYGGKLIPGSAPTTMSDPTVMTPKRQSALIERVLFSSIGALVAVSILGFLGILIYWMGFRLPPASQVMPYKRSTSTGQYAAVGYGAPAAGQYTPPPAMRPVDPSTGVVRGVAPVPPVDIPPASFDDTGPIKTVRTATDLSGGAIPGSTPAPQRPPVVSSGDWSPDDPLPPADDDTGRYRPKRD